MEMTVLSHAGKAGASKAVSDRLFDAAYNEALIHQSVTAYLAGARQGTKAQKNRSACRGGGAKPWRQKGTGRARAGTSRSPLWRSGGVTFAASPRDYSKKVNRKAHAAAMRSALSELHRQSRVQVVDQITIAGPKTKSYLAYMETLSIESPSLIVIANEDVDLFLATRNLPNLSVTLASELTVVELVSAQSVLFTVDAITQLEERLG